ncbi:single strand-specific nuclease [Angomonas deanei]|uniref:S1/P1 Nuclease, putative n=1 Tax=Angomonas deanei TaxID=59799 RepID=S9UHM3_9TRYP|nr:single strand-specific nuclease [Angomonas deanei]EPY35213.1 single strand-specific nuclease [Angomonas deanei]CAD2218175.1 S1/P1 Nuclease, putative [Angomonas deanei]|eukprot:EPY28229.1 single strand-specific nuclease [Angomonas deanei]
MWHQYSMSAWHYIDLPLVLNGSLPRGKEGGPPSSPDAYTSPASLTHALLTDIIPSVPKPHVISSIRDMLTALKNTNSTTKTKIPLFHYQFALFHLVHFIGDAHQPLHCATLYSDRFPDGDHGGNLFHVFYHGKEVKLHAVWDDLCRLAEPRPHDDKDRRRLTKHTLHRPLSPEEYDTYIRQVSEELEDAYKIDEESLIKEKNVELYAAESYQYAMNTTYAGLRPGDELTEDYLERCRHTTEKRIVLAGRRLAYWLNTLLEDMDVSQNST